ncbi:MAG: helix-turn-helix domain-containing protein [Desulfovibrio sp.]|nr:helix-turn-helix domain-containing protein [Desulfovibrio sp.]
MDIAGRIKLVRGKLSQEEFAQQLGVHKNSLGRYERGDSSPDVGVAERICSVFGVDPQWLLLGIGSMRQGGKLPAPLLSNDNQSEAEIITIPLVEARLSAGHGSFETAGDTQTSYSFPYSFLARKGRPNRMVLMYVSGDSMEPEIKDGDLVLIDQAQTDLLPDKIYATGVEDMVFLKRVFAVPGKVILKSINPDYPPFEIDTRGDMADAVRILGRAVWWCREG